MTSGNSLLSCCVTKKAAIVANTSSANTTRTRGRLMAAEASGAPVRRRIPPMRVQLVDPSGDVIPYDHALAGALARRGADVELVTSRFVHGPRRSPTATR